mmetsp:Transcript_28450/g.62288  ORF Transcript_28450/g.62288 Transcript_28450/m.62288 type:complete len:200 (-) Transcript_28450:426-1025(-)
MPPRRVLPNLNSESSTAPCQCRVQPPARYERLSAHGPVTSSLLIPSAFRGSTLSLLRSSTNDSLAALSASWRSSALPGGAASGGACGSVSFSKPRECFSLRMRRTDWFTRSSGIKPAVTSSYSSSANEVSEGTMLMSMDVRSMAILTASCGVAAVLCQSYKFSISLQSVTNMPVKLRVSRSRWLRYWLLLTMGTLFSSL